MGDVVKFRRRNWPITSAYGIVEMWTLIQYDDNFDWLRRPRITILRDGIEYRLPPDPPDVA